MALGAIIGAVVAIAGSAIGQASQNKANRAKKRNSANANQMGSQGAADATAPTATRFAEGGSAGNVSPTRAAQSNILGQDSSLPDLPMGARMSQVSEQQQGQGLGMKSMENAPSPITDANPYTEMPKTQVDPPKTQASDYAGYGQQALQLALAYKQLKDAGRPQPQPAAQLGQMNLQPTATRFGV